MAPAPLISVIIPAWNSGHRITMVLDAIGRQTTPRDRFEVIVVDNGSTDGTADAARHYDFVKVLSEPIASSYRARNKGLAEARGTYVLLTDADCVPDPDWMAQAIVAIGQGPEDGLFAGEVALFREEGGSPLAAAYEELFAFNQRSNVARGFCITANWLCRRDDMRAIGGFNPNLLSGGDGDCARRMTAAGHQLVHVPGMVVRHPTRASLRELVHKRRRVVGGLWTRIFKDAGVPRTLRQYVRETYDQAREVWRSDRDVLTKIGVIGILGVLMLTSQAEVLRLASGRPPYRS